MIENQQGSCPNCLRLQTVRCNIEDLSTMETELIMAAVDGTVEDEIADILQAKAGDYADEMLRSPVIVAEVHQTLMADLEVELEAVRARKAVLMRTAAVIVANCTTGPPRFCTAEEEPPRPDAADNN